MSLDSEGKRREVLNFCGRIHVVTQENTTLILLDEIRLNSTQWEIPILLKANYGENNSLRYILCWSSLDVYM